MSEYYSGVPSIIYIQGPLSTTYIKAMLVCLEIEHRAKIERRCGLCLLFGVVDLFVFYLAFF